MFLLCEIAFSVGRGFDFKLTLMAYPGSSKAVPWQSTVPFSANESFDFIAIFISFVFVVWGCIRKWGRWGEVNFIFFCFLLFNNPILLANDLTAESSPAVTQISSIRNDENSYARCKFVALDRVD